MHLSELNGNVAPSERREAALVEEYLRAEAADVRYGQQGQAKATSAEWIKTEPQDNDNFDLTATFFVDDIVDNIVPQSEMELQEQSRKVSDSIWEDLRASINMVELCGAQEESNVCQRVKIEPMEAEHKPSCQFENLKSISKYNLQAVKSENSALLNGSKITDRPKSLGVQQIQHDHLSQQGAASASTAMSPLQYIQNFHKSTVQYGPHTPPHMVPVLLPPTPPSSQPASPSQDAIRKTPPPPYPGLARQLGASSVNCIPVTSIAPLNMGMPVNSLGMATTKNAKTPNTHPGCSTIKYNRKNNPELEKRRVHFCDFPGELDNIMRTYYLTISV